MAAEDAKYFDRGKRLEEFYTSRAYGSRTAFAVDLGIPQQHVSAYFFGQRDPMNLSAELIKLGADVNYIITGMKSEEQKNSEPVIRYHGTPSEETKKRMQSIVQLIADNPDAPIETIEAVVREIVKGK